MTDMLGRPVFHQQVDPTSEIKFQPRAGLYIWRLTLENGVVKDGETRCRIACNCFDGCRIGHRF